jgi:hypothetical protein
MEPWMQGEIDSLVSEHGTVPPPWVIFDEHPYSICWRMGSGESYQLLWWEWWRLRWPRLFGQIFRFDKWIVCRG